jgi:HEAT repeat protein
VAAIMRWVLTEKEEKVAAGFMAALEPLDATASGAAGQRWNGAARAVVDAFLTVLRDAQSRRPNDGAAVANDVVRAAAPAVAQALRQADPAATAALLRTLRLFAPAARDVVPALAQALRHEDATVRLGAVSALGAFGPAARSAVPDLQRALEDADPAVREAAAGALRQIQGQ